MNILRESMTKFTAGAETVRVWREERGAVGVDNSDLRARAAELKADKWAGMHLAGELLKMKRVNAVEVVETETGNGWVLYRLENDGSF